MTRIYGMDLKSYLNFSPNINMNALALEGNFDYKITYNEQMIDGSYDNFLRVCADDISEQVSGGSLLTSEQAYKIVLFIKSTIDNHKDLIVHCNAGVSRTGAIMFLCYNLFKIPCTKVIVNKQSIFQKVITINNFNDEYVPNDYWVIQLTRAYDALIIKENMIYKNKGKV